MNRTQFALTLPLALALAGCGAPAERPAPVVDHSFAANGSRVSTSAYSPTASPSGGAGSGASGTASSHVATQPGGALPPVYVDDSNTMVRDWRPRVYTVQTGDTLYGIAFNFGLDYHDLAALNNITDPTVIHVGQVLRLFPGVAVGAGAAAGAHASTPAAPVIVSQPLIVKLPYSSQAVAQAEQQAAAPVAAVPAVASASTPAAGAVSGTEGVYVKAGVAPGNVGVKWEMPASGRVVAGFSEVENRKGIDIAGKRGEAVYASAPGKVVYAGSGLRGYGRLVIIKHNDVYLSAYAHNDKLLVKEGQMVSQGQMIAQMGSSDADRVALHFEIRKLGRPVDPAKYLVLPKS
jgi:lipoprotein NlpD